MHPYGLSQRVTLCSAERNCSVVHRSGRLRTQLKFALVDRTSTGRRPATRAALFCPPRPISVATEHTSRPVSLPALSHHPTRLYLQSLSLENHSNLCENYVIYKEVNLEIEYWKYHRNASILQITKKKYKHTTSL